MTIYFGEENEQYPNTEARTGNIRCRSPACITALIGIESQVLESTIVHVGRILLITLFMNVRNVLLGTSARFMLYVQPMFLCPSKHFGSLHIGLSISILVPCIDVSHYDGLRGRDSSCGVKNFSKLICTGSGRHIKL